MEEREGGNLKGEAREKEREMERELESEIERQIMLDQVAMQFTARSGQWM